MRVDMVAVNFLGIKLRMYSLRRLMGNFKNRAQEREQAQYLYICSVQQARESKFYTICGVADTLDGRFDQVVMSAGEDRKPGTSASTHQLLGQYQDIRPCDFLPFPHD